MIICSVDPDWVPDDEQRLELDKVLVEQGIWPVNNTGKYPEHWVEGGFKRFQLMTHERPTLVANHQGGYRVYCPTEEKLITADFVDAIKVYRNGGLRQLSCSLCRANHDLNHLIYQPSAAFALFEIQFHGAQSIELSSVATEWFREWMGEFHTIIRRLG
jgi:hypothetical protein